MNDLIDLDEYRKDKEAYEKSIAELKEKSRPIKAPNLEKAKELLCTTNMKVAQVSEKTGFTNVSYFCRSFREYYGSSPESYRKGTGEDEEISDRIDKKI